MAARAGSIPCRRSRRRATPSETRPRGAKIYLGKTLFWEEQLSSTRTVACGTCHRGRSGGSDPRSVERSSRHPGFDGIFTTDDDAMGSPGVPLNRAGGTYQWSPSFGIREQVTRRKAQSAINAAYSISSDAGLLWDGKASHRFSDPLTGDVVIETGAALESQALLPILNTVEMNHEGATWADVVTRLTESRPLVLSPALPPALAAWIGIRGYPDLFSEAFGTPEITPARIPMAIASYERTLFSDRTPFDAVVSSIRQESPAEMRGREVFFEAPLPQVPHGIGDIRSVVSKYRAPSAKGGWGPRRSHRSCFRVGQVSHCKSSKCRVASSLHA